MSNANSQLAAFRDRAIGHEDEKRAAAEGLKDLRVEMKSAGLSPSDIAGVFLAVKRHYESADKRAARTAAEEVADMLGASGDAPLFASREA